MKPKYIQVNCREIESAKEKLDLRQAEAVLKYKPDIIILEYPNNNESPDSPLNKYKALDKPKEMVAERVKEFPVEVIKENPWVRADTIMWKNVASLWAQGHQVLIYPVDAPSELTKEWLDVWRGAYPCIKKNWVWWVQIYLRERMMTNNMKWILANYKEKENPIVLVFLQSFHWEHVRFLLKDPTKDEIWNYYFGKFQAVTKENIKEKIENLNKIFCKYWRNFADF